MVEEVKATDLLHPDFQIFYIKTFFYLRAFHTHLFCVLSKIIESTKKLFS